MENPCAFEEANTCTNLMTLSIGASMGTTDKFSPHLHTSALSSRHQQILDTAPLRLQFVSYTEPSKRQVRRTQAIGVTARMRKRPKNASAKCAA